MKILFVSLGCDKNLVDSEHMLAMLRREGFELTDDEAEADAIVVNTCCFIHDAMEESIQTLIDLGRYKEEGSQKALVAVGCLAQRYAQEIRQEIPEVDAIVGTNAYDEIVAVLRSTLKGERPTVIRPLKGLRDDNAGRVLTTGGHYAYLKIAEGCDKRCTYCVIPQIRGDYRSVPMEQLVAEAADLVNQGVQELILVAQETTVYGRDLYGKKALPELLTRLGALEGLRWIRLLYCYPEEITGELMDVMASNPKICHYIDMPIQHCNDEILRRMGRRTSRQDIEEIIAALRKRMPDIAIRTTLICGFPGENQAQHEELLDFIRQMKFDRLGAFPYSRQEQTPAADFEHQVPEETKKLWADEVMELQQEVSAAKNETFVGKRLEAFVEGKVADEPVYIGRTYRDAPDVDGYVFISSERELVTGEFVEVDITGAYEYDLIGDLAE